MNLSWNDGVRKPNQWPVAIITKLRNFISFSAIAQSTLLALRQAASPGVYDVTVTVDSGVLLDCRGFGLLAAVIRRRAWTTWLMTCFLSHLQISNYSERLEHQTTGVWQAVRSAVDLMVDCGPDSLPYWGESDRSRCHISTTTGCSSPLPETCVHSPVDRKALGIELRGLPERPGAGNMFPELDGGVSWGWGWIHHGCYAGKSPGQPRVCQQLQSTVTQGDRDAFLQAYPGFS